MQPSAKLLTLCSYRWNVPVIAHLHRREDSFVALVKVLSVSRDALSRTLDALIGVQWLARIGGQHPHYALTNTGEALAPGCAAIVTAVKDLQLKEIAYRRWTLPITSSLENWSLHFGELKMMLPEITPRALTLALKEMQAAGLIERHIEDSFPPSAAYRLSEKGGLFLPALRRVNSAR